MTTKQLRKKFEQRFLGVCISEPILEMRWRDYLAGYRAAQRERRKK